MKKNSNMTKLEILTKKLKIFIIRLEIFVKKLGILIEFLIISFFLCPYIAAEHYLSSYKDKKDK